MSEHGEIMLRLAEITGILHRIKRRMDELEQPATEDAPPKRTLKPGYFQPVSEIWKRESEGGLAHFVGPVGDAGVEDCYEDAPSWKPPVQFMGLDEYELRFLVGIAKADYPALVDVARIKAQAAREREAKKADHD